MIKIFFQILPECSEVFIKQDNDNSKSNVEHDSLRFSASRSGREVENLENKIVNAKPRIKTQHTFHSS